MNERPPATDRVGLVLARAHRLLARRVWATAVVALLAAAALVVLGDTARVALHDGSGFPSRSGVGAVAGEHRDVAVAPAVDPPGPIPTAPRSAELAAPASVVARYENGIVVVSWTAAPEAPAPVRYVVRRQPRGAEATVRGASYRDSAVRLGTTYRYEIAGVDADGAESPPASVVVALFGPAPATLASVSGVKAEVLAGSSRVRVRWEPSADDVDHYVVHRDGVPLAHLPAAQADYLDGGVVVGATYVYDVEARDDAGSRSPRSSAAKVTIPPADRTPPTAPRDLGLAVQCVCGEPSSLLLLRLRWSAATDDVGVTAYRVYRNGTPVATLEPSAREYFDNITRPPRGDRYVYVVRAIDGAGNVGAASNPAEYAEPG